MNPQICAAECIVCREAITNPICPDCLTNEAKIWIAENSPDLAGFILKPEAVTESFMHSASRCVVCGNSMAVCAHCYSRDMFQQLAQEEPSMAAEFARVFNFEFTRVIR